MKIVKMGYEYYIIDNVFKITKLNTLYHSKNINDIYKFIQEHKNTLDYYSLLEDFYNLK